MDIDTEAEFDSCVSAVGLGQCSYMSRTVTERGNLNNGSGYGASKSIMLHLYFYIFSFPTLQEMDGGVCKYFTAVGEWIVLLVRHFLQTQQI